MVNISEHEFRLLVDFIHMNYGINLSKKRNLIETRLGNVIEEKGFNSFSEYIKLIKSDMSGAEVTKLVNKLTTNHTFFMREYKHLIFQG